MNCELCDKEDAKVYRHDLRDGPENMLLCVRCNMRVLEALQVIHYVNLRKRGFMED